MRYKIHKKTNDNKMKGAYLMDLKNDVKYVKGVGPNRVVLLNKLGIYTLEDLKNKGFSPLDYKMFTFTSHYRNKLNFTWDSLESAKIALSRLKEGYNRHLEGKEDVSDSVIADYENKFHEAINDDLNMPVAMSVVWEVIKNQKKSKKLADLILDFDRVLGFDLDHYKPEEVIIPEEIKMLVNERNEARANKNWTESDRLRDELISKGYSVKDSKEGTVVEKI